ncbi:Vacuolar protein 8 [Mortierella sp. AD094]|nr:Vacuolar protein 8 [Mortierella sp. AD094]
MAKANRLGEEGIVDSLSALAISSNANAQQPGTAALRENTLQDIEKVDSRALKPLIQSLKSENDVVLSMALITLTRLAENADNTKLIVRSGVMVPLIKLLKSPCIDIHPTAVIFLFHLSNQDQNKKSIASSGVLPPLLRQALSKDVIVQRAAVATLANLAEPCENKQMVIDAGAAPVLVSILRDLRENDQINCLIALNYIAFGLLNLGILSPSSKDLVETLVVMSRSTTLRGEQEVSTAFRFLAEDEIFRREIVRRGGLNCLRRFLLSADQTIIITSLTCINTISNQPQHQSQLINGGFLNRLSELLEYGEMEEVQSKAASTLFRLAHNNELGRAAVLNAKVVERVRELFLDVPPEVQGLMSILVSTLIDSDKLRPRLVRLGVVDIFIYCTASSFEKAPGYGMMSLIKLLEKLPDLQPLANAWETPVEGIQGGLLRFLDSSDEKHRKLAIMAITLMLKGKSERLRNLVKNSAKLKSAVRRVAQVSAKAITGKLTWESGDIFNPRVLNVKMAMALVNIIEGRNPRATLSLREDLNG